MLGRWDFYKLKVHTRLPNVSQCKVLLYLPPFGPNSNVTLWHSNSLWRKGVDLAMSSSHSYSTTLHTVGLSCVTWSQYTTPQIDARQTKRSGQNRRRLCNTIVVPIKLAFNQSAPTCIGLPVCQELFVRQTFCCSTDQLFSAQ